MNLEIQQILTQAAGFFILVWLMRKFAWTPLLKVIDDRSGKIATDLENIKTAKDEAVSLQAKYENSIAHIDEEAQERFKIVLDDAQVKSKEIIDEARENAKRIIESSQESARQEVNKVKEQLKAEVAIIAIQVAAKILNSELDAGKHKMLITNTIDKIERF